MVVVAVSLVVAVLVASLAVASSEVVLVASLVEASFVVVGIPLVAFLADIALVEDKPSFVVVAELVEQCFE